MCEEDMGEWRYDIGDAGGALEEAYHLTEDTTLFCMYENFFLSILKMGSENCDR